MSSFDKAVPRDAAIRRRGARSEQRLCALLQASTGVAIAPTALATVRKAAQHWMGGDPALAHFHLAFARLPRLADSEAAFRLFLADELLKTGMTPAELIEALDTANVVKFDPDQPRVPAGSGRASGQWTTGSSGDANAPVVNGRRIGMSPPSSDHPFVVPIFLDDSARNKEDHEELLFEQERRLGTETPDEDVAHGRPIPVAPPVAPLPFMFGPKPATGGGRQPPIEPPDGPSDNEPKLCPQPEPDRPGGRKDFDLLFQQYIGTVVNPGKPLVDPRLGYALRDPLTGRLVFFDHCRFSNGRMVEAKGHFGDGPNDTFMKKMLSIDWLGQAKRQVRAAQAAGGRHVEWWFYEKEAADLARSIFEEDDYLKGKISVYQKDYPGDDQWPYPPSATWATRRGRR